MLTSVALVVNAHPGRTDSNGGHIDNSTGEYHYHHGYRAHNHYDMDGDGQVDCPYDFHDKTNHSSDNGNYSNNDVDFDIPSTPTIDSETDSKDSGTQQGKGEGNIYCYISLGFVIVFFILVNCWAIRIDRTDTSPNDEPISLPSFFISVYSTIIVFCLLFCIMCLFKQPITWRDISFKEMLQILFFSAILGGIVWLFTNWASLLLNTLICTLFKVEVYGWSGCFQRLTIPLSYAFTVLLFILQ
jgi:hypothetical protein